MNERIVYRSIILFIAIVSTYACWELNKDGNNGIGMAIISGLALISIGLSFSRESN